MSTKCLVCNKVKGKRGCRIHDMKMVCSRCCSDIRNANCNPCSYYSIAEQYHAEKYQKSDGKSFLVEIDATIEKQVDTALSNVEKRRFAQAEKILTPLLKAHSENHYVNFGIGILYAFQGENKKAISYFKKAIEIFPYFVEAHYNLGIAYHKEINIAGMVRSFQNVLRMGTPDEIYYNEAKRLLASTEKMIRDVNKTDLHTFITTQDIFHKGLKLTENGEWEQAIRLYEECLTLNPTIPQPHGNLGICYARMGRKEEAIEAFDRALAIDPNYELAIANKMFTEKLAPGEALDVPVRVVEYYKEYPAENRSYIKELAEEMITRLDCAGEDEKSVTTRSGLKR